MNVLTVSNLTKVYPSFTLDNVSFSLEPGKITGFIGRNGAGKSTTLNSLFNFVHPDSGEVQFFGRNFAENQKETKQKVGFVSSGVNYYPKKKIGKISQITRSFYDSWDQDAYKKYLDMFQLQETKTPSELSAGMKVKYALALALSHNADLLILDEPTSGLDPVSRDDLLDVFMELCSRGKTILFSTHITSDLDKCADNIIYIKEGKIIADCSVTEFENKYKVAEFSNEQEMDAYQDSILGRKRTRKGFTALLPTADALEKGLTCSDADLETIMIHLEKGAEKDD